MGWGQTIGIYESYALVSVNGAANTFYDLTAATANPDFSGANLGTYNQTNTLVLSGAQIKTFKCNGGNVTGGNTYYRVWLQGGSIPSYSTLSPTMSFMSNDAGGCGGNQTWQTSTATVNLLQGLGVGTYNVEVYTAATGSPTTATTASFIATFTVNSVFGDNFNRASLTPGGSPSMTYTNTLATGASATLNASAFLDIVNSTTSGVSYVTGSTSSYASPYATTLSSNTGIVTWTFNMRYNRTTHPSGFAASNYGQAVVLGGTDANIATSGNGYAVVYGNSGATDPIRLVAYSTGLAGTLTDICTSASNDIALVNNYASVRVTFNPATNAWSLFVRDDGATAWTDPISGVTAQKGTTTTNSTYTGSSLTTFGYLWNHSGTAAQSAQFDRFNVQVAPSTTPTLSIPTAAVTSSTSATLGATIVSNGGSSLTARGTAYKTTTGVVATDNQLAEGGTGVSAFTHTRTGLSPQTQYFYVGYATNTVSNTGISAEGSFRTWSEAATVQPATYTTTPGSSSLVANWGSATFPSIGAAQAGYVVIYATGTPTLSSANGTAPAAGVGTLVNITPTALPTTPALTTTITGLTNGQLYNLLIVPYTWDGTNASTYNYFTTGAKTATGTPAAVSYTWNGGTSGAWSTASNWTPLGVPNAGDNVIFNSGGNISITSVPTVSLSSITISTLGTNVTLASPSTGNTTITLSNTGTALSIATGTTLNLIGNTTSSRTMTLAYSGSGNTATVAGTLNLQTSGAGTANYNATNSTTTVGGIFRLSSATAAITSTTSNLVIGAAGEYNVASNGGVLPTATWTAGSTLRVTGIATATAFSGNSVSQTFSNVIWECASQTSAFVFVSVTTAPSTSSISGDLTVNTTNTGSLQIPGSDKATISVANYTQTGGTVYVSNGSTSNRTLNVTGNFTLNQNTTASSFIISETGSVGTHTLNIGGNFTMTAGTITRNAVVANVNFNGTGVQVVSKTGGTIVGMVNFIVLSPRTVDFPATSVLDGTAATFNINSGATLQTANLFGISASGATGSIQVGGTRTFNSGSNYTYYAASNQLTGSGLPTALTGTLTFANTGAAPNNVVTLSQATSTSGTLALSSGSLDLNALTLTLSSNVAQSITGASGNTFNITGASGSTIALSAPSTSHVVTLSNFGTGNSANLVTGANVNVQLNSNTQLDCAGNGSSTSMLTVLGSFTLNSAILSNIANVHPPFYGAGSTLIYNVNYGRFSEWINTSGPGYPFDVKITGNANLDAVNSVNSYKKAAGSLIVTTGSTFSIPNLTIGNGTTGIGVEFLGNIINDGTISLNTGSNSTSQRLKAVTLTNGNSNSTATVNLSGSIGGDLELTGNYIDNANFTANSRAIFFTGTGVQTIGGNASAPFNIDYIVVTKASGFVQLSKDLLTAAPSMGNSITLSNSIDILDLNGFNLTLGSSGLSSSVSGNGFIKGSNTSSLTLLGTGNLGTVRFDQTIPGTTNALNNFTINRTTSGSVVLGNAVTVTNALTITNGNVNLGTAYHTAGSLTLGVATQEIGSSYGGTGSAAATINTTFFAGTTGVVNVGNCSSYSLTSTSVASPSCSGSGASVTLANATTAHLPAGTYTIYYTLTGANTGSYTASMTVSTAGSGTFTTGSLVNTGSTIITINNIRNGCVSAISVNNTATFTVNSITSAAVISGTATICNGSSSNLSVAITGGTSPFAIVYSDGTSNFTINNYTTGSGISVSPSSTKTYTLLSVTNAEGCAGSGNSGAAVVTVNPTSVAGTVSANQNICSDSSPSNITLTGSTGTIQWQSSSDNINFTDITNATSSPLTSAQMESLNATTFYRAIVTSGFCSAATSNVVTIMVNTPIYSYNNSGTWDTASNWNLSCDNGANYSVSTSEPTSPSIAYVNNGQTVSVSNLTVNSGNQVIVRAGGKLTVSGVLTNNGTLKIESGGSLVQENGSIQSGSGTYIAERDITGSTDGQGLPNGRFWYIGVPMTGTTASAVSVESQSNRLWRYEEGPTQGYLEHTSNNTALLQGRGYAFRGATGTYAFTSNNIGNGPVSFTVTRTAGTSKPGWNLIANPYPSHISWSTLYDNTLVNGVAGTSPLQPTIYYRTVNTQNQNVFEFYNRSTNTGTSNNQPTQVTSTLAPFQAFWVRLKDGYSTYSFQSNNGDRLHGNQNLLTVDPSRVRLNISNGVTRDETVVVLMEDLSNGYDSNDSDKEIPSATMHQIYSLEGTKRVVINGIGDALAKDTLKLGVQIPTAGTYTINCTEFTFADLVYLEDKLTGAYLELSNPINYSFTSDAGTFNNRFVLHFVVLQQHWLLKYLHQYSHPLCLQ